MTAQGNNTGAGGVGNPATGDLAGHTSAHTPGAEAFKLDRPSIRTSFDRASAQYESAAVLQGRVNDELLERLELFKFQPGVIVDLGAGTGRGTEELKRRYRRALVIALDMA